MAIVPGSEHAPHDILDDVGGTYMTDEQTEGGLPAECHGRWTGLYRRRAKGWHLVNVFTSRLEAVRYFNGLNDGHDYRLAPLRGTLRTVPFGR